MQALVKRFEIAKCILLFLLANMVISIYTDTN